MRRRHLLAMLGSPALAWPLAARAQQPAVAVIGILSVGSQAPGWPFIAALRQILSELGYVEGRNLVIDARYAEGRYDRLPAIAEELVRRPVTVLIAIGGSAPALAAKAATAAIPILFGVTDDPVKLDLVASIARPGGNATGVHFLLSQLGAKQLGLLRELLPSAARFGLLVNPHNANAEAVTREVMAAADALGSEINVLRASDSRAIEAAFATLVHTRCAALLVGPDPFLFSRRVQLATLAARHAIPAVYNVREYPEVGGLMSYGTSLMEMYRQIGAYTGRLLKGARPAELPVVQSTRFELVINLATARALGLEIPPALLARADEAIE